MNKQAASFPTSIIEYVRREKIMAGSLLEAGITSFEGKEVKRGDVYSADVIDVKELNHVRMLKTFRSKYGTDYAREYVKWFVPHHKLMVSKYPEYFDKKKKESFLKRFKSVIAK